MLNRRDVLHLAAGTAATAVSSAGFPAAAPAEEFRNSELAIIDTNVSLLQWPFRRLPFDTPDALSRKLRSLGIVRALAGSFEGLLHRDISEVNRRLFEATRKFPEFLPIGSINPGLPDWKSDLQRCVEEHNMKGIRLHPTYHGYTLDDPRLAQVLERATAAGRFVQIAAAMEDTRTQHTLVQVPEVDLSPLTRLTTDIPGLRVQILNHRLRPPLRDHLAACPGIYFDTARVEGTDAVPAIMKSAPGRVLFGSHAPFLIPEAALIRVHESGSLSNAALRSVFCEDAATALLKDA